MIYSKICNYLPPPHRWSDDMEQARTQCPFCDSDNFVVYDTRELWWCPDCGKGGNIYSFIMEIKGVPYRKAKSIVDGTPYLDPAMMAIPSKEKK